MEARVWIPNDLTTTGQRIAAMLLDRFEPVSVIADELDAKDARIAELEGLIAEQGAELEAYSAFNQDARIAELERIIEDMQNGAARYDARITMMEQKERQYKEHMSRLHARIADLEEQLDNALGELITESRERAAYQVANAELEAQKQKLIDNLKRSGGSYYEMQQQYGVIFAENCELQGRIAELEEERDNETSVRKIAAAKLQTSIEMQDAQLGEIDRLTERIADLTLQAKVLNITLTSSADALIDAEERIAELTEALNAAKQHAVYSL